MKKLTILLILNIFLFGNIYSQTTDNNGYRDYIKKSHKLQNEGKQEEAIVLLTEAIAKFPNHSILYMERASFYFQIKKFDLMESDTLEAVRVSKDKYNAYISAAMNLTIIKKFDKAMAYYTDAINLDPSRSDAYVNRASLQSNHLKNNAAALNDINYALSIDPEDNFAKSLKNKISAELANQKPGYETNSELIETLEQKLANAPQDKRIKRELSILYIYRSRIFEKEKNIEEMFVDIDRAVEINNDSQMIRMRGKKLFQYKYYEEAIKDFTEVIKQQPQSWLTYVYLGDSYLFLKQFDKALETYKKALTIELASERLINSRIKRMQQKMQKQTVQ